MKLCKSYSAMALIIFYYTYIIRYLDKKLLLRLNAGRVIIGTLRGYDQFMNLVLENAAEMKGSESIPIPSMCVVRGCSVVQFEQQAAY